MKWFLTCMAMAWSLAVSAQDVQISVEVSTDSVLLGNYFEVIFSLENARGEFEAPDLSPFVILGGPNQSSRFSMINGEVSQSVSIRYYLKPPEIGNYIIPPAFFTVDDTVYETPPIEVIVVHNPDQITVNPHENDHLRKKFEPLKKEKKDVEGEKKKSKKKRKVIKI